MGMIFIRREERRRSLESLGQCAERIADGKSILIFPEGTRSRDGRIGSFKPGIFIPTIDTGVPVIPIVIEGTDRILPPGGFRARPGKIRVAIGRPIPTAGLERRDRRTLARQVRQQMVPATSGRPSVY